MRHPTKGNIVKNGIILIGSAAALALAGCSSADDKPRKGKYKPEIALTKIEMPGLPDGAKEQMKTAMEGSFAQQAGEQCISGKQGGDWKQAADGMSKSMGGKCETTRDKGTDTTADLEVKCTGTQMGDIVVTMKGAAESESFKMDVDMQLKSLPAPMKGEGALGMTISAKRVGDC